MAQVVVHIQSKHNEELIDITEKLKEIASVHPEAQLMAVFAKGATAGIIIQENWDPNIPKDILSCLKQLVPSGQWLHDQVDHNGDAHIKAGMVGASETIPLSKGEMLLGTWQNVFFADFDGPRRDREVIITLLP